MTLYTCHDKEVKTIADRRLLNEGIMQGTYAGAPFEDSHSTLLEVLLTGVTFEKTADQEVWFGGALTVTFTIDNTAGEGPLNALIINDLLDNTKFDYILNSVIVQLNDGTATTTLTIGTDYTVTFTPDTPTMTQDTLVFSFVETGAIGSIPVGSIVTISFRGNKVPE